MGINTGFRALMRGLDGAIKNAQANIITRSGNILSSSVYKNTKKTVNDLGTVKFTKLGYVPDGTKLPNEYLVSITSYRAKATITGILQENMMIGIESIWEPFIPTEMYGSVDTAVQAISGGKWSLITKATSRRKWKGSTPLEISLVLKFRAVEDAFKEVVEPCRILQSLALPSEGKDAAGLSTIADIKKAIPFLAPPGPTPFTTEDLLNQDAGTIRGVKQDAILQGLRGGDLIILRFGRFLNLFNVILKSARINFVPRFDIKGNPIAADATLIFESYEIMTAESLAFAYKKDILSEGE